jgi:response regulator of citrate/malate metabolism
MPAMKIMLVSKDQSLIQMVGKAIPRQKNDLMIYNESADPLDVMSAICTQNPSLIIVDDDLLSPYSAHILNSVRKINQHVDIFFATSDTGIDLGKEISQLGIQYYAIKPLAESELADSLKSVIDLIAKRIY